MSGISNVLRDIHRLRKHAHELEEQIDRAPVQLKAQKNKAAKAEATFAEAQEAYRHFEGRGHFGKVVITHD